jgi:hippurate hydrolase
MQLIESILADAAAVAAIRREIHANPELAYQEFRTADLVAQTLARWGIPVHRGLGGTGVVGIVKGTAGTSTRAIGLRADMDALPIQEHNTFAHASKNPGKMHACGHDGHTAMLLAAAKHFSTQRDFDGTVYLIFQPAEEGGGGAKKMIDDGLFTQFPMQAVFGMHNWPGSKVGTFAMTPGPMMASSNEFTITIHGKGAHAALPHNGIDPVMVAVNMAQALQTILTRNKKPIDAAVLSITQIHTGDVDNVIPDTAMLNGTVRTFTLPVLNLIEQRMREIAQGIAATFGATAQVNFHRNYPPTINSVAEAAFCAKVAASVVGAENVAANCEPTMGAEDFAYMLLEKPGCYVFIGNGDGTHRNAGHGLGPCNLHNPSYDFNDDLIPLGATYWARLAHMWFAQTPASGA